MMNFLQLPERMRDGLKMYVMHGIEPGGFLTAVLCNDLKQACAQADDENRHLLFEYVKTLYNEVPAPCWGSSQAVRDWVARGGHNGRVA